MFILICISLTDMFVFVFVVFHERHHICLVPLKGDGGGPNNKIQGDYLCVYFDLYFSYGYVCICICCIP